MHRQACRACAYVQEPARAKPTPLKAKPVIARSLVLSFFPLIHEARAETPRCSAKDDNMNTERTLMTTLKFAVRLGLLIAVALLVLFAFPLILRMVSWTAGEIGLPHWLLYSFALVTAFLVL